MVKIPVLRSITEANALLADAIRARFVQQDVLVLNIIASPGAGKTALLERTIEKLHGELRLSSGRRAHQCRWGAGGADQY